MWRHSEQNPPEDGEREGNQLPKLIPGMLLEVLTSQNRLIFRGEIAEVNDDGDAICITDTDGANLPYVEYNSRVKLRGFSGTEAICLVGMIGGSTATFWKIDRLCTLQTSERRDYFRQIVSVGAEVSKIEDPVDEQMTAEDDEQEKAAEVTSTTSLRSGSRAEAVHAEATGTSAAGIPSGVYTSSCRILDISAGGCMLITKGIYQIGDKLSMKNVTIIPGKPPFDFRCVVRRAIKRENLWEYGCEFQELGSKEQERLIRMILVLQRNELQARRTKG